MFRVGQKIVCVVGHDNPPQYGAVREGQIFTVRSLGLTIRGEAGIRLIEQELSCGPREVSATTGKPFKDAFYLASRFRPLVERKTSIEIFTKMLTPTGKESVNV